MKKLNDYATRATAGMSEAVEMRQKISDGLGDEINGADVGKRHALLELRRELEAAAPELATASARVASIADRLAALAVKKEAA
jgi:hypothetical protein